MKTPKRTFLFYESILVLFIIIAPFLLYLHLIIPNELEQYDTVFGMINAGYFDTIENYVYWFFSKFVPLFLLIILYLTHNKWWSHAIIIPIATYLFQLVSVINDNLEIIDEVEFIYILPIMIIVMVPLYFIRKKLSIYIAATDLKKEMEAKMSKTN